MLRLLQYNTEYSIFFKKLSHIVKLLVITKHNIT